MYMCSCEGAPLCKHKYRYTIKWARLTHLIKEYCCMHIETSLDSHMCQLNHWNPVETNACTDSQLGEPHGKEVAWVSNCARGKEIAWVWGYSKLLRQAGTLTVSSSRFIVNTSPLRVCRKADFQDTRAQILHLNKRTQHSLPNNRSLQVCKILHWQTTCIRALTVNLLMRNI